MTTTTHNTNTPDEAFYALIPNSIDTTEQDTPPTCQISWIDENGVATPDTHEAVGRVYTVSRTVAIAGHNIHFDESDHYLICASHATRLGNAGMEHWRFETLSS